MTDSNVYYKNPWIEQKNARNPVGLPPEMSIISQEKHRMHVIDELSQHCSDLQHAQATVGSPCDKMLVDIP